MRHSKTSSFLQMKIHSRTFESRPPFAGCLALKLIPLTLSLAWLHVGSGQPANNQAEVSVERPVVRPAAPAIAVYSWPADRGIIPLEAEIRTEITDGIPESKVFLDGGGLQFNLRVSNDFVVASDRKDASCRLINRLMPENALSFSLFQPGSFLPAVNQTTLRGYQLGLEKQHGESIAIDQDSDLIPRKTFSVLGNRWGRVRYRIESPDGERSFVEYFIPLAGRLLVLRLEGNDSFVQAKESRIVRMISTLTMERQPGSP